MRIVIAPLSAAMFVVTPVLLFLWLASGFLQRGGDLVRLLVELLRALRGEVTPWLSILSAAKRFSSSTFAARASSESSIVTS